MGMLNQNLITPETLNLVREIMTDILNEYHKTDNDKITITVTQ